MDDWRKGKDAKPAAKAYGRGNEQQPHFAQADDSGRRKGGGAADAWGGDASTQEPSNLEEFERIRMQAREQWAKPVKVRPLFLNPVGACR